MARCYSKYYYYQYEVVVDVKRSESKTAAFEAERFLGCSHFGRT